MLVTQRLYFKNMSALCEQRTLRIVRTQTLLVTGFIFLRRSVVIHAILLVIAAYVREFKLDKLGEQDPLLGHTGLTCMLGIQDSQHAGKYHQASWLADSMS